MRAILTFHCVDDRPGPLSVTPDALRGILRGALAGGFRFVRMDRILDEPADARALALTFDDGYRSVWEAARPVLAELGAPATLFVISGRIEAPHDPPMLTWEQVRGLAEMGFEIGAHTATHPDLRRLPRPAIEQEMDACIAAIEQYTGVRPTSFAYPVGWFSPDAVAAARARFARSVTTRMGWLPRAPGDLHLLPRLDAYYLCAPAMHARFWQPAGRAALRLRGLLRKVRWGRYG